MEKLTKLSYQVLEREHEDFIKEGNIVRKINAIIEHINTNKINSVVLISEPKDEATAKAERHIRKIKDTLKQFKSQSLITQEKMHKALIATIVSELDEED